MGEHDSGYKQLFAHPALVRDLLAGFTPFACFRDLPLNAFERLNASFVSDGFDERHGDMVWRVRLDGESIYVPIDELESFTMGKRFISKFDNWGDAFVDSVQRETYRTVLTKMLRQRFGTLPEDAGEAMETAELAQLKKWFDLALSGFAVADIFAGAGSADTAGHQGPT